MRWLGSNQEASKEDYASHRQQLEKKCNPIMSKVYGAAPRF
jgi:hypothetical protein